MTSSRALDLLVSVYAIQLVACIEDIDLSNMFFTDSVPEKFLIVNAAGDEPSALLGGVHPSLKDRKFTWSKHILHTVRNPGS